MQKREIEEKKTTSKKKHSNNNSDNINHISLQKNPGIYTAHIRFGVM